LQTGNTGWFHEDYYLIGNTSGTVSLSTSTKNAATQEYLKITEPYTITAFGTDKTNSVETRTVNSASDHGTITLTDLNNDAVKFTITGENDPTALVSVDLTMEALNPYVNNVDIVAKQTGVETQPISQQYLADDFTVGEGESFNVPTGYDENGITFTFENLRSKHADNTYGPFSNNGNSRYNFVKSVYYNAVNEDLYTNAEMVKDHTYTDKIAVAQAGDKLFVFNNAAELDHNNIDSETKYLTEDMFSLAKYRDVTKGTFDYVNLAKGKTSKECYLFTTDETRYNIAPTTKTMHKYYAYYKTLINLVAKDYTPSFTYTPIYNSTLHGTSSDADTNPFVGVKLGVTETDKGFLSVKQINDKIAADIKAKTTNAPADLAHVLYVDASPLVSVMSNASSGTLDALKTNLAKNALVYLPLKAIYTADNYAYQTISGGFKAGNNIVLTDKEPFFAPYDIQVDATHYAEYKRLITKDKYGKQTWGTVILPFTLKDLKDGVHTDYYGTATILQMNQTNATKDGVDNYGTAFFSAIKETEAAANTPYALQATPNDDVKADANVSFAFRQYGSNIVATPTAHITHTIYSPDPAITSTGKLGGTAYSFSHKGTFSGTQIDKAKDIFYFADDGFYSSKDLDNNYTNVNVRPFRTFYDYTGVTGAKVNFLSMEIGENTDVTGINNITSGGNTSVVAGDGTITVTATNGDETFRVNNVTGQGISKVSLKAGDSRTISVPSGLYIVNGVKVIVK
jgi:hypothetical protein